MFTLCFFAFLRVGEVSAKSVKSRKNVILLENLTILEPIKAAQYITLTLRHFKHNNSSRPGSMNGPLFTFEGSTPVSQAFFTLELRNALCYVGLDPKLYKSHSFRIGAASYAFHLKFPKTRYV
jgi:hypothetical protein